MYFIFLLFLKVGYLFIVFPKGLLLVFNKATEFNLFSNLATH